MAFIHELNINESKEHKEAKFKLFEKIVDGEFTFITQYNEEIKIKQFNDWEYIYMEAYIYKELENAYDPYKNQHCYMCIEGYLNSIGKQFNFEEYDENYEFYDAEKFSRREYNENLYTFDKEKWTATYLSHPCSICKYKGKLDCIMIFDIGLSRKGDYTYAIEIVKSSTCTPNKIKYCMDKNLPILEVDYRDILNLSDEDKSVKCNLLWGYKDKDNKILRYSQSKRFNI